MAKSAKTLRDIAIKQQLALEGFKTTQSKALITSVGKFVDGVLKVSTSSPTAIGVLAKVNVDKILSKISKLGKSQIDKAIVSLEKNLMSMSNLISSDEAKGLTQVLKNASGKKIEIKLLKKGEAYSLALKTPLSANGALVMQLWKDWSKKEVTQAQNLVRQAWSQGWTNDELSRAIRGTRAARYKNGLSAKVKREADTVAQTSTQHVGNQARMQTWENNKDILDGYEWVSTLDADTCHVCQGLDLQKFVFGKGPNPPIHFNCRCTTTPTFKDEFDLSFLDKGATRSSVSGYVPAKENYYDWLKKQDDDFQDKALGKKRAQLLRDGDLTVTEFRKLNLTRNFEARTLEEMKTMNAEAFEKAGL